MSSKNHFDSLNVMGFLNLKGIEMGKNEKLSYEYFKRATKIQEKDADSNFACYKLCNEQGLKYDFLGKVVLNNHPKTLGTLAYLIGAGNLDNE